MKVIEAYLTPNEYSRPQTKLTNVRFLVIHWVFNKNSSAMANRNFFENRKNGKDGYGSAHDIIDLNGDLIKCLPYDELAYHVGSSQPYKAGSSQIYCPVVWDKLNNNSNKSLKPYPNANSVSVECTHLDDNGTMTKETYDSLVTWCVDKLKMFNLTVDDLYLHQEIVGWKDCHRWFVNNPSEWTNFKTKVAQLMNPIQEDEDEMKLTEDQWKMLGDSFDGLFHKGLITDYKWAEKSYKGELTLSELTWLNTIVFSRQNGIQV